MKIYRIILSMTVVLLVTLSAQVLRAAVWGEDATAAAPAPVCGNGILESQYPYNEECDPANIPGWSDINDPVPCSNPNLICTDKCKCVQAIGTGLVTMQFESMVNVIPSTTPGTAEGSCGNGTVAGTEECDVAGEYGDANYAAGVAAQCNKVERVKAIGTLSADTPYLRCDSCKCIWCGDLLLEPGEQCSVSGKKGSDPTERVPQLTLAYLAPPYKECAVGYDCAQCTCSSDIPTLQAVCGNGIFETGEECGETDEAGASLTCENTDAQCVNCKCVVTETCGNGHFEHALEECDFAEDPAHIFKACNASKKTTNVPYICSDDCKCLLCGNGQWESKAQVGPELGEECDPNEGEVGINRHCNYTKGTSGTQYACTDACTCVTCGNGILDTDLGEQCELDANGNLTADSLCKADEVCDGCKCYEKPSNVCHDGKLDPGEQCDSDGTVADGSWATPAEEQASADAKCATGETCIFNCTCQEDGTPISDTPVPMSKTCSVKITGASSDDAQEYLNKLNAKVHEIIGTDAIDIFGEIGYSVAAVNIQFTDTAAPSSVTLDSSISKIAVGDTNVGAWALLQLGGTPPYDYAKEHFLPALTAIKEPLIIFPVGAEPAGENVAKALGLKDVVFPNLSSVAGLESVTLNDVVGVMGSENVNFTVASATSMKVNNFIRWEVKPALTASKVAGTEIGGTVQEGEFRMPWDWPNFTGVEGFTVPEGMKEEDMYIENRQMDINLVFEELEKRAAEWKSAGRDISCDIVAELPYEANLNMQYMAVQNKVSAGGGVDTQGFAGLAVVGEMARGGGCGGKCSMVASVPPMGHVALFLGFAATGLGSIVAVRRRKM